MEPVDGGSRGFSAALKNQAIALKLALINISAFCIYVLLRQKSVKICSVTGK